MRTTGERILTSPMLRLGAGRVVGTAVPVGRRRCQTGVAGCMVGRAQARARRRGWSGRAGLAGSTGIIRRMRRRLAGTRGGRFGCFAGCWRSGRAAVRRIGVEGPTLTQDAREASSARVAAQSANARARPSRRLIPAAVRFRLVGFLELLPRRRDHQRAATLSVS
jgi:hypothetical protein